MSLPGNGIYVVRGEMATLMTAMRRGSRWNAASYVDEEKDGLMKLFVDLKQVLNHIDDLRQIDPNVFLAPFLEVIRTDETTGAVTSLALVAVNKFLSYGLIDPTTPNLAIIVEHIVDAVTHARFMGTDQSSDGVTLLRVVEVLHTLIRSPEGSALSNESVCEVLLSCFKICFEPRLNELLRRSAEQSLKDMVLLFFMRLPQFTEERSDTVMLGRFQIGDASLHSDKKQRKKQQKHTTAGTTDKQARQKSTNERKLSTGSTLSDDPISPQFPSGVGHVSENLKVPPLATTPATPAGNILDMQGKITQTPTTALSSVTDTEINTELSTLQPVSVAGSVPDIQVNAASPEAAPTVQQQGGKTVTDLEGSSEYINSVGVRFTQQNSIEGSDSAAQTPYGLPFIKELFRFLIMLCNPLDKQNTDNMMHTGLSLLTVAFEVAADNIGKYDTLLELVKDDLCRNLISLMNSERLSIFAADLQLCFLLFESLRGHLKFQLEAYLRKLSEIIASDNPKTPYEMRELALDNLHQLWRIPGFVTELYINYDCDLYSTDMFESLTNLLSKYTLSATNAVYSTHIISMDTLISVIDSIERSCTVAKTLGSSNCNIQEAGITAPSGTGSRHSRQSSGLEGIIVDNGSGGSTVINHENAAVENISKFINNSSSTRMRLNSGHNASENGAINITSPTITRDHLADVKKKKHLLSQGTELFNQHPEKGIHYLQENGILNAQLDPMEVALFLRENPGLDKIMIGDYISKKKNVESKILLNFVDSFDFHGLRVDQALRLYLETFRLPGEAPLIFLVLEHFADHWHKQNGEPFSNTDAAFSLAYAIIMLNMDQHNSNAKRLNVPMTPEDFSKNLRGLNGGSDFDQDMLSTIFNAIKNEEIVMPAEQTGLVRENYLWKVLLRRGITNGAFHYVHDSSYDIEIFNIIWRASLSALSFMFDKSSENGYQRTLTGFIKCAAISARYNLHEDLDALILTLCKFTTLLNTVEQDVPTPVHNDIVQAVNFGLNPKAQAAMRTVFLLVHDYGDCLRDGWKNILDLFLQLFRLKLLPKALMEVEDFCEANGKAQLVLEKPREKQEAGLFSSLYSYLSSEGQREPSYEEQEFIKLGKKCIKECQLEQMLQESKFVQLESLQELLKDVLALIKAPNAHKSIGIPYAEDVVVFWMEFLVKIVVHNRDRMIPLWPSVRDHMYLLLMGSASCGYDYLLNRCIVAVLKIAIYLMRNEELCPIVLQSLKMLLMLKPAVVLRISKQISIGIYELLKTSAQNIHSEQDWQIIFTLLECVGAGAMPPDFEDATLPVPNGLSTKSDGTLSSEEDSGLPDRGYNSESELSAKQDQSAINVNNPHPSSPSTENWILINKDTDLSVLSRPQSPPDVATNTNSLVFKCRLMDHSPFALFKCWDSLAFIVRNVAHITPYNFESCVRCIRTFVEASRDGGIRQRRLLASTGGDSKLLLKANRNKNTAAAKRAEREAATRKAAAAAQSSNAATPLITTAADSDNVLVEADEEELAQRYETLSIQLLDLMYTLYTRTAQIFRWWAEEGCTMPQCSALWAQGWCPLLQGIARLAMDRRREVRTYAISCLQQRALLVHDLQTLSGAEWSSCFQQVLFPLLNQMLPDSPGIVHLDPVLLEESRIRTATIMSKVFLHHLTSLIDLGNGFNELWIDILDYIDKFMKVGSDMLSEQMQEILKNMLLVMHSVRVFHNNDGALHLALWELTWHRIGEFLPNLKDELFRDEGKRMQVMSHATAAATATTIANDPTSVPPVAIVPTSVNPLIQQQHQTTGELIVSQTPIVSPVESPRHSIILQPPNADVLSTQPFFLGQLATSQTMPILVPPQQPSSHQQTPRATTPTLPMPSAKLETATITTSALPDLVNEASIHAQLTPLPSPQKQQTIEKINKEELMESVSSTTQTPSSVVAETQQSYNSYSYAIELPETPPTQPIYSEQTLVQNISAKAEAAAVTAQVQLQQEQHQLLLQHQQQQHYQQYYQQMAVQQQAAGVESAETNNVNVPISHLLAGSQYPSLSKMPNAAIVHSFAPVYVHSEAPQTVADIYQDYVQNPYNLTLQQQQQQQQQHHQHQNNLQQSPTVPQQINTLDKPSSLGLHTQHYDSSSPANYFNTNIDPSTIPPGSELLYGQQ